MAPRGERLWLQCLSLWCESNCCPLEGSCGKSNWSDDFQRLHFKFTTVHPWLSAGWSQLLWSSLCRDESQGILCRMLRGLLQHQQVSQRLFSLHPWRAESLWSSRLCYVRKDLGTKKWGRGVWSTILQGIWTKMWCSTSDTACQAPFPGLGWEGSSGSSSGHLADQKGATKTAELWVHIKCLKRSTSFQDAMPKDAYDSCDVFLITLVLSIFRFSLVLLSDLLFWQSFPKPLTLISDWSDIVNIIFHHPLLLIVWRRLFECA